MIRSARTLDKDQQLNPRRCHNGVALRRRFKHPSGAREAIGDNTTEQIITTLGDYLHYTPLNPTSAIFNRLRPCVQDPGEATRD